jgi:hypothetical protein
MLSFPLIIMKRETFAVADIYVPVNRRATLVQKRVDESPPACSTSASKHQSWCVRTARVSCWSRAYTAAKGLGEKTIIGFGVEARKH